jgi:hypothetical protein
LNSNFSIFEYSLSIAPTGCLQHFTTPTGTVESLNFRGIGKATPVLTPGQQFPQFLPNQVYQVFPSPNYYNNMHYGICVAKQPKMCAIRWQAIQFDFGGRTIAMSSSETNCVEYAVGDDIGDYITIPNSSLDGKTLLLNRFCGQRLNPDVANSGSNADVICMLNILLLRRHPYSAHACMEGEGV